MRQPAALDPCEEVREHLLREIGLGDDPVGDRPDDRHRPRLAAQHRLRLTSSGQHLVVTHRDDGRLVEHQAGATRNDPRVRGPQVDGEIGREEPAQQR